MDCLLGILKSWFQTLATKQIGYINDLDKNIQDMKNKRDELAGRASDLSREVKIAEIQRTDLKSGVKDWLEKVEEIKREVDEIEKHDRNMLGCLPNYYAQRNLSIRALEAVETLSNLRSLCEDRKFTEAVAVRPLPTTANLLPTASLIGKSAEKAKNRIVEWINDRGVGIIGVYGMGGVGKTTIIQNVNNHLKDANLFEYIFFVTVSQDIDLKKLQMKIAMEFNFTLPVSYLNSTSIPPIQNPTSGLR